MIKDHILRNVKGLTKIRYFAFIFIVVLLAISFISIQMIGGYSENQSNKIITVNLSYKNGTSFDMDNDGTETIDGVIDYTVEYANFSWGINYSKLGTRWFIHSIDNGQTTTLCYGEQKTCNFVELEPSIDQWNETFNVYYGRYDASYNSTIGAQVIYVDYDIESENPYSEIIYSELNHLPAKFLKPNEIITYTKVASYLKEEPSNYLLKNFFILGI